MDKSLTISLACSGYVDSSDGKCLKTVGRDGRSYLSPVSYKVGMERKGECVSVAERLLGV